MTTAGELAVPPEQLSEVGYGVIMDDAGPVALVAADHGPLPALLIPSELALAELADSAVLTLLDEYPHLAGFVVIDAAGAVAGVLPVAALDDYLGSGRYVPRSSMMGPAGQAGDVDVPGDSRLPRARIRCHATGCGYVNTLTYIDPANLPTCANPDPPAHPLSLRRA